MEETKKIGLFRALFNVINSISDNSDLSEQPIDYSELTKKDFENAGVTENEKAEHEKSLARMKTGTIKFFSNVKTRVENTISKLKGDNSKTPNESTAKKTVKKEENTVEELTK